MIEYIIFLSSFYFLLLSVIGYGLIFQNLCFEKIKNFNDENSIFIGFNGLFLITLISLITSLFVPHNFFHNLILHIIGIVFFIIYKAENKKKYLKYIILISILVFSAVLISKTNDDLSYYHLSFTKYLTEQKIIFGMGHLSHGYNLLSSLFFLNSTFYLPFINFFSFHFSLIFFLIFFNFFVIREIILIKNDELIRFLYLFAFVFFNLSFNRLAEYGTDKAGQLLVVILIIKLLHYLNLNKNKFNLNILFLIPLFGYCISLKTYFLSYLILGVLILFLNSKLVESIRNIFVSKSFLFFLVLLIFYFSHHFISTGCLISPLPFTCLGDTLIWGREKNDIINLSIWLEQWAKAGAGPNFRVENVKEYIENFNWISNWIDRYFVGKFLDQLGILFSTFILIFLIFKNFKTELNKKFSYRNFTLIYSLIFIIFFVWLISHPTLRYGGYSVVFLVISLPISLLFYFFQSKKISGRKLIFVILFVTILFNLKNITRIHKEFNSNDIFRFENFPYYFIKEKNFETHTFESGLRIYQTHHCWATPTPCGHVDDKTFVKKKNGYYFIGKYK